MTGTCKDCVHWHPRGGDEEVPLGECVLSDPVYQSLTGRTAGFVRTGEGLLLTRARHGCNEFEGQKEDGR